MSESKHTPGPWMVSEISGNVAAVNSPENGGDIVCEPPDRFEASMEYWDANARLIAAAPELLEACEAALKALSGLIESEFETIRNPHPADSDPDVIRLVAVIKKAKGE